LQKNIFKKLALYAAMRIDIMVNQWIKSWTCWTREIVEVGLCFLIRPLLCFSLFCVRVRVGFEPRKLQNKQKKNSTKYISS
jgi:hypothetical protein